MFKIFKEGAGVISPMTMWVIFDGGYMYESKTLISVLFKFITQYKDDRHFVG